VALSPVPSLGRAVLDAVGPPRGGTPPAWRDAICGHLRAQDHETLAPLATPAQTLVPDPLLGLTGPPGESFADGVERMLATPIESLSYEMAECRAGTGNDVWLAAERDPQRWLRRYVAALLRAWKGFGSIWRHARPALDRESERVAMATAFDAQLELLDGLRHDASVDDGRWCVRCAFDEGRVRFPEDGLVLMPLVAGERSSITATSDDVVGLVAYPLRSISGRAPARPPSAALEALLGIPRARILRAVGSSATIGRLAELLRAVPSAATHHVSALEAAGLVVRERAGRSVLVRRTARGDALVQLYDG
jgi:DNA-binding transcriptional ArsR family regulator